MHGRDASGGRGGSSPHHPQRADSGSCAGADADSGAASGLPRRTAAARGAAAAPTLRREPSRAEAQALGQLSAREHHQHQRDKLNSLPVVHHKRGSSRGQRGGNSRTIMPRRSTGPHAGKRPRSSEEAKGIATVGEGVQVVADAPRTLKRPRFDHPTAARSPEATPTGAERRKVLVQATPSHSSDRARRASVSQSDEPRLLVQESPHLVHL